MIEELKENVIKVYTKYGNEKAYVLKGNKSYTGFEIAQHIKDETALGISIMNSLLSLTIDLVKRNKINNKHETLL